MTGIKNATAAAAPKRLQTDAFPKTTAATNALKALAKETGGKTTGARIDAIIEKAFGKYEKMTPDQAREASVALNAARSGFHGFALNHLKQQLAFVQERSQ